MLEKLFTSQTRVKLLTLLIFDQDSEFHLRGIARKIGVSPTYTKKELENLVSLNLVKKAKKANLNLYRINRDNIFLHDLRRIFIKTEYFGELLKKVLRDRVKYAFIYGSYAQGTENSLSDIDLFVVSDIPEDTLLTAVQDIEKATQREINYILWDEKTFRQRAKTHNLLKTIKRGRVIMLAGNEKELRNSIG